MPQVRKTRQQKVQHRQRQAATPSRDAGAVDAVPVSNNAIIANELAKPNLAIDAHIQATYTYAWEELRRIGWISLVCLGLLLVASLLLSEIPAIVELRNTLSLPNLSPFN